MSQTIIESLVYAIGLDVTKMKQGAELARKEAKQTGKAIETELGAGNKQVESLAKGIAGVSKAVHGLVSALAVRAMAQFFDQVNRANLELKNTAADMGMSAQSLKTWGSAAEATGGSAQGLAASFGAISKAQTDLQLSGNSSLMPYMNALGVSMMDMSGKARPVEAVMGDLADRFSQMDRVKAANIAQSMGIDDGTFRLLVKGRAEVDRIKASMASNRAMSALEEKNAEKFLEAQAKLKASWGTLEMVIVSKLTPAVTWLSDKLSAMVEWFSKNEKMLNLALGAIAVVITATVLPGIISVTTALYALLVPAGLLSAPFLLIAGIVALLIDDFLTWKSGGESLFGSLYSHADKVFKQFSGEGLKAVNDVKDAFGSLWEMVKSIGNFIGSLFTGDWEKIKQAGKDAGEAIKNAWQKTFAAGGSWVDTTKKVLFGEPEKVEQLPQKDLSQGTVDEQRELRRAQNVPAQPQYDLSKGDAYDKRELNRANAQPQPPKTETVITPAKEGLLTPAVDAIKASDIGQGVSKMVDKAKKTIALTEQDIKDIVKVASTEVVPSLKGKNFDDQLKGVIDTILNRVASGKWGNSVRSVVNAKSQFSKISGLGTKGKDKEYGSVQNMPDSAINKKVMETGIEYIKQRANGAKSSVADNLNYANPNREYISKNNWGWVGKLEEEARKSGMVYGAGKAVHVHGTTDDLKKSKPGEFSIALPNDLQTYTRLASNQGRVDMAAAQTSNVSKSQKTEVAINGGIHVHTDARTAEAATTRGLEEAAKRQQTISLFNYGVG